MLTKGRRSCVVKACMEYVILLLVLGILHVTAASDFGGLEDVPPVCVHQQDHCEGRIILTNSRVRFGKVRLERRKRVAVEQLV